MQRDKLKILKKYAYALKQGANCRSEIFEYLKLDLFNPNRKQEQIRATRRIRVKAKSKFDYLLADKTV